MKILLIGGTGIIGKAVANELGKRHEIISSGTKSGDIHIDITQTESIENAYKKLGNIDAVVITTGSVHFGPLTDINNEQFNIGIQSKLMGQINVVLIGMKYLQNGGSFTLTSGILSHDPIKFGSSASTINAAIDGFVRGAAIEMPNNQRINVVSPTLVLESLDVYGPYFRGFQTISSQQLAQYYSKSVEGAQTGQVYKAGY